MENIVQFKTKIIILILIIITSPLWLNLLNFIFSFLLNAGRVVGTYIRLIESGAICLF